MLDTTTHVAGPRIKVGRRVLQRCAICGEKLADNTDRSLLVFWTEGEMVQSSPDSALCRVGDFLNRKNQPADLCLALVEP